MIPWLDLMLCGGTFVSLCVGSSDSNGFSSSEAGKGFGNPRSLRTLQHTTHVKMSDVKTGCIF